MINYRILIDGVDYTNSCALPFKEQYVLDSALDNGVLTIPMIARKEIFKPFTKVQITRDNDTYTMLIARDKVTEVVASGKYTHDLVLIEETKLLEKKVVDTNTTTQPLVHDYFKEVGNVLVSGYYQNPQETHYYNSTIVSSLYSTTNITLPSLKQWFDQSYSPLGPIEWKPLVKYACSVKVYEIDDQKNPIYNYENELYGTSSDWEITHNLLQYVDYNKSYLVKYSRSLQGGTTTPLNDSFGFSIYLPNQVRNDKSITDVVNRLLTITETLRANDTPALTFNEEQAQFYSNIVAPEFSMTKSTLRECLDQVGSYIHSIVRLKDNVIYFDKLGGETQAILGEDYIGSYETLDSEQYATQLDSIVSNLVNIDNEQQGTIIEPFRDAYKTVRAESGTIRINDEGAIIQTDCPIEKVQKLVCGYIKIKGTDYYVGDITASVYESAEYKLLSSTGGIYPNSKGYAITYTQGEKNITGLTFKLPNPISSIFSNQAILNIISQKIGQPIQTLFNVQDITELNFQLIYYPSTTARVKQSKTNITDFDSELTSIYNQSANKVDSRVYGENLKGTIARLGNIEKFITFTTKNTNNLLEVGNYVIIDNEDYYIATLDIENQIDHIKYTVGLSKDFNALSKYIGIKNNIRLYEVSEKQSVERYVTYDDYCVIGEAITSDNKHLITSTAIEQTVLQFTGFKGGSYPISVARLKGYDIENNPLQQVDLPVFSLGLGNSIWLGCKYEDNYNAGNKSIKATNGTDNAYYRVQDYVKYTDLWGELETLDVKMYDYLDGITTQEQAVEVGNALPADNLTPVTQAKISSGNDRLVIKKDSREQINLSYQLYFVTNDKIVIGSQLAQGNRLVTDITTNATSASLYILPTRINKFATKIDLTNATLIRNYDQDNTHITANNTQVIFANETATASGKSWVLVDNASGNLLFGKNIAIENGEAIKMPTMTFTHKVI